MAVQVNLRPFEEDHTSRLTRWFNDPSNLPLIGHSPKNELEIREMVDLMRKDGAVILLIESRQGEELGWIHLSHISYQHGRAEIGILLAPQHQGQGYGEAAMLQMLNIAFNQLRLNKLYLTTRGINEKARSLYVKLGFHEEGVLKDHCYVNGKYYDTYFMSLFDADWRSK